LVQKGNETTPYFNSRGGVTIVGDNAFVRETTAALKLLKNRTPDVYALLQKHIGCVVSSKPTRVSSHFFAACCVTSLLAYAPTTVVLMRPYGSELPIEERAGILAHETYHAELYRRAQNGDRHQVPPENAYAGERAETLCVAYQCEVLRRLGLDEWGRPSARAHAPIQMVGSTGRRLVLLTCPLTIFGGDREPWVVASAGSGYRLNG
jgi:hypothetical protein